ncbi:PstS family phosphate ABC transporter substrate-binding protein [Geitlerinema sp. PCC 9228]|uniref:PstS family phosphate ABC transporter substrate-binding protein n=1 Tax=Geitlerinema sp. PCC 9228 TaxID=111611 RepID=UPI0008F9AD32|nr:PstS family phosphate ABC transporter substrate-binding protein [Geitlerinema sp. PCC 9228]
MKFRTLAPSKPILASLAIAALTLSACGGQGGNQAADNATGEGEGATETAAGGGDSQLSGDVMVDGSSTVFPISEAMAEEFMKENNDVRVTVGVSGSGGGFKKFCAGETDISNASRPIKPSEIEACQENGIEFVELPIAFDGISVTVNPQNDWASCLTVDELKTIWEPQAEGQITNWSQVRGEFPDQELSLYGPGTDSGTFDYFTEAIVGEDGASRGDYTASEDDNVLVQGVANEAGAMGYFGYAYFEENEDKLKALEVDGGDGCVGPSRQTIADGTYQPLARPIFFYVKKDSLENKPQVRAFAQYQLNTANNTYISEVGYIPLPETLYQKAQSRLEAGTTGTMFEGGTTVGVNLSEEL